MINGDISNESSPRLIVLIEAVVNYEVVEKRDFFVKKQVLKITGLNNPTLSHLWNISMKYGLSVELAAYASSGWAPDDLEYVMDKLDRRGGNPFNYSELYESHQDFLGELPYRNNLKGVVSDGHAAMYGHWGIDLFNL